MKICIIGYSARKIAPYLQYYIDYFLDRNVNFDFITREIDSNHLDSSVLSNQYVIESIRSNNIIGKFRNIVEWKIKVEKIIKENKYDSLVLLTGYPTIILSKFIIKNYCKRYIVDIRDYISLFGNVFLKNRFIDALNNAAFVVVSSDGFRTWLPSINHILTVHNCPNKCITSKKCTLVNSKTVRIGYFGVISYIDKNIKLMDYFCNEQDFKLVYAGVYDKSASLQTHVKDRHIDNVVFYGAFNNDDKEELYENVDMINAIYGNESLIVSSALPNKLYDAILYKKPIIVSENTFLSKIVEEYNLGISVDINTNPVNRIREYIRDFNEDLFNLGAKRLLEKCQRDNNYFMEMLDQFVSGFYGVKE